MMNSEARKRAAGIAASNPPAPEPTPTLGDAPGADSEALAARDVLAEILSEHTFAWTTSGFSCLGCDHVLVPGSAGSYSGFANPDEVKAMIRQHQADAVLASSWLADHDRQTAERAWFECAQAIAWATNNGPDPIEYLAANNPYSEEARRG